MELIVMCIYYGDCPFVTTDCEEDTPHYKCSYRLPIRQALEQAHMAGQADAGVDPGYSNAQTYAKSVLST